jgi:hypothetical protein
MSNSVDTQASKQLETYGFPHSIFVPPKSFNEKEQVVLAAYLVNKLRTQSTINAIEDAYQAALTQIKENPEVLSEMYVEIMQKLAAHVAGGDGHTTLENQNFVGIDREILEVCEPTLKEVDMKKDLLENLGIEPS